MNITDITASKPNSGSDYGFRPGCESAARTGTDRRLYEEIMFRSEGRLDPPGPVLVNTGKHTARAAADKFVVREQSTEDASGGATTIVPSPARTSARC